MIDLRVRVLKAPPSWLPTWREVVLMVIVFSGVLFIGLVLP